MNLTETDISKIAKHLFDLKLIAKDSVSRVITDLEGLSLQKVSETTNIDKSFLQAFVNQTLPCLHDVSKINPNTTGYESDYEMMMEECFFIKPIPPLPTYPVCDEDATSAFISFIMFIISITLLLTMTFFVQRRRRACLRWCWGFPGPVVPLNMLDSYENRKGYMLSFAITIASIVSVFLGNRRGLLGDGDKLVVEISASKPYVGVFINIILSIYVAVMNYPFFIAQNIHNKLIGSILGILLCLTWSFLEAFKMYIFAATCFKQYERDNMKNLNIIVIFYDVPKYACLLLLTIKFVYVLVKTLKLRAEKKRKGLEVNWLYEDDTDWRKEYMYTHVKEVFQKHRMKDTKTVNDTEAISFKDKMIRLLKSKLYKVKPGFRYSTRMAISTFSAVLAVYMLSLSIVMLGYLIFSWIWGSIFNNEIVNLLSAVTGISLQTIKDYLNAVEVSYWVGLVLSILFYVFVLVNSLTWYRGHIIRLRAGDRSFLPNSIKNQSLGPGALMVASFKFAGFQVAYAGWGFLITYVIMVISTYVIATQIFFPMIRNELSILLTLIINLWPNILIAVLMVIAQNVMVRCFFLHDTDTIAVDNRRAYHIMSYFLFYFNILLGIVSCLVRILFGMIFGVIFLQRLAKSTLPRSYERRDPGYLAYLGFIMMEHQHSNPVLQCFVRLLLETQGMELKDEFFTNPQSEKTAVVSLIKISVKNDNLKELKAKKIRRALIRNRWYLYAMLSLNPSIIKYRVRVLPEIKKEKQTSFFKSRFAFAFRNESFDEEGIMVKEAIPEDGIAFEYSDNEGKEEKTNTTDKLLKESADNNYCKNPDSITIDAKSGTKNNKITGNDDTKVDIGEMEDVNVDFRDNSLNVADADDSTPILMRRKNIQSTPC